MHHQLRGAMRLLDVASKAPKEKGPIAHVQLVENPRRNAQENAQFVGDVKTKTSLVSFPSLLSQNGFNRSKSPQPTARTHFGLHRRYPINQGTAFKSRVRCHRRSTAKHRSLQVRFINRQWRDLLPNFSQRPLSGKADFKEHCFHACNCDEQANALPG